MTKRARKQPRDPNLPLRVVTYRRVSTDEQGASGHGLDAQAETLRVAVEYRGWTVAADLVDAGVSGGKALQKRPAGSEALRLLSSGAADVLMVSKLDRLSRSMPDFVNICAQSEAEGWAICLIDLDIDTTTPAGELTGGVLALIGQYERRMASVRTREGLAAAKVKGVRLGRPRTLPLEVLARISRERAQGRTLRAIADGLTADAVPTAQGGVWRPGTVAAVLSSQDAQAATA
jgi:DNA invertase Pin-like site-specific DNA recombinase